MVANLIDEMSEKDFQTSVMQYALQFGWKYWHLADARKIVRTPQGPKIVGDKDAAGLPDLFLVHALHGFVHAELKREKDFRIRAAQVRASRAMSEAALRAALTGCKVRVHLWHPSDIDTVILPLLRTGTGPITHGWD